MLIYLTNVLHGAFVGLFGPGSHATNGNAGPHLSSRTEPEAAVAGRKAELPGWPLSKCLWFPKLLYVGEGILDTAFGFGLAEDG